MTDTVADMLTRIRNGYSARHEKVEMPPARFKLAIAQVLKESGYIRDYEVVHAGGRPVLRIHLRYGEGKRAAMSGIRRISRPGLRVYAGKDELPKVLGGLGVAIVSTPQGVMTDKEARRRGVGGEVLCFVW
ncbi:MAG: 30S ribosomal protein S8 [Limnochordaceae bacterium]|nr:30S ribosomal protein S8 [Limnochordaceae bacterium]